MRGWRCALAALVLLAGADVARAAGFEIVVLGARGGIEDGDLSAYLVRPAGDLRGVLCDAGSVVAGVRAAVRAGAFDDIMVPSGTDRAAFVVRDVIKGYLLSHAHLDHVAGLVAVSPDDAPKPIYAWASVNAALSAHLFNWDIWPNMGDRGIAPRLARYHYRDLTPARETSIEGTGLRVTAYPLSHGGVVSSAFLISSGADAVLYLGDTGADAQEHASGLHDLWAAMAALVRAGRLRGIMIECSYDDARPDAQLFGHLRPALVADALRDLQAVSGASLRGMQVLVTHIKPGIGSDAAAVRTIMAELAAHDTTGVRFVAATQGARLVW